MTPRPTVALITGGRGYANAAHVDEVLDVALAYYQGGLAIVQGGARGADALAKAWCKRRGVPCATVDAWWDYYGNPAGGMRNGWMLSLLQPDFVLAFPGGYGTADMMKRARLAGVPVYEVQP